jgi:predicted permease
MLDPVRRDVQYALRSLRRAPGFAAAAILSLTLGLGATMAILTLLDAVVFKPLPVARVGELVELYEVPSKETPDTSGGTGQYLVFSYPRFQRLVTALGARGTLAAMTRSSRFVVRRARTAELEVARAQLVSGTYFTVLGARVVTGRPLTPEDVRDERPASVAVVSDGFARRSLGGIEEAIGQELIVGDLPVIVVGVAGPGFVGAWTDTGADLWLPLTLQHDLGYRSNVSSYANADRNQPWVAQDSIAWLTVIGRIRPAELPQARAILQAANQVGLQELVAPFDQEGRQEMLSHRMAVESFARGFSGLRERYGDALLALAGMVIVVLLLTCANLANLVLARAMARAGETGIRAALGATRWTLVRQCLIESAVIGAAGGITGFLAGRWVSQALAGEVLNTSADALPPVFAGDGRMILLAVLTTGTAILLFGVFPAWRGTRVDPRVGSGSQARAGLPISRLRSMRPFVIAQLAMSFVLVMAAALFGRTLVSFVRLDLGFDPHGVVEVTLDPMLSGYTAEQMPALSDRILAAVRTTPAATSAAFSFCSLGANCSSGFRVPPTGATAEERVQLHNSWVGPEFFQTLGIKRIRGRVFTDGDTTNSPRVAVISESVARRYFPGANPVGQRLGYQKFDLEIVGVVGEVRGPDLREPPAPVVYMPITQASGFGLPLSTLDVRVAGEADRMVLAIRNAIRRVDPGLFIDRIRSKDERLDRALLRERLVAYLSAAFGALAILLASVGLYGVLSYSVTGRTREIGIRTALGAWPGSLVSMILRDAVRIVVPGVVLGVVAVGFAGRLVESQLFGVTARDPATFVAVSGVLTIVAMMAALVPARRAARLDPIRALQTE